jgi:hypothetical protein
MTTVVDRTEDDAPDEGSQIGRNAYRSYFSFTARPSSLQLVLGQFSGWLRKRKDIDVDLHESRFDEVGRRTLTVAHNDKADGRQTRCTLVEQRPRESWRTELTLFSPTRAARGWVNLAVSSDQGYPAEPPKVFEQIVGVLDDPRDGALPLRGEPPVIGESGVNDVVEWITDPERHALLFVAGTGEQIEFGPWVDKVRLWARGMKGMAQAVVLDPRSTDALAQRLGPAHAVSPWTIRTFQPAALLGNAADGHRHRILGINRLVSTPDPEIRRFLSRIARRHANDRVTPPSLTRATRDLDRVTTALRLNSIFEPKNS